MVKQNKHHSGMAIVEVAIVVLLVFVLLIVGLYYANTLRTNACITDASDEVLQKVANDPSLYKVFNANVYSWTATTWQAAFSTLETYFKRSDGKLALCGLADKRFLQVKYFAIASDGTEFAVDGTYSFALILPGQKIQVEQVDSNGATTGWVNVFHPEKSPEQGRGVELPQLLTLYPVRGSAFIHKTNVFDNAFGNNSSDFDRKNLDKSARNISRYMNVGSVTPTPFGWTPPPPTSSPAASPTAGPGTASPTSAAQGTNTPAAPTATPDTTQTPDSTQTAGAAATQTAAAGNPTSTPSAGPSPTGTAGPGPTDTPGGGGPTPTPGGGAVQCSFSPRPCACPIPAQPMCDDSDPACAFTRILCQMALDCMNNPNCPPDCSKLGCNNGQQFCNCAGINQAYCEMSKMLAAAEACWTDVNTLNCIWHCNYDDLPAQLVACDDCCAGHPERCAVCDCVD